ncbi:MAG: hypothetical protein FJ382_07170 [Verrucomicrobia bacterium]|nr:hypothetical protein [Verrucomicrobiota bacterium]
MNTPQAIPSPDRVIVVGAEAGPNVDPWTEVVRLEYGGDGSFAAILREQVARTPAAGLGRLEAQLLRALAAPDLTEAGRDFLCSQLALVGSAAAVPALAALLANAESADAARLALERIPGPEADAALLAGLATLTGRARTGLVGSIGARRSAGARDALARLAADPAEDAELRAIAARSLALLRPATVGTAP